MPSNEELIKVDAEIKHLQEQQEKAEDDYYSKMEELKKRQHSLRLVNLLESKLLKNSEWVLRLNNSRLILNLTCSDSLLNDLRNLFDAQWHCSFELNEAQIEFNDNAVLLVFTKENEMIQFAKLYELKVSLDSLNKEIIRLKLLETLRDVVWTDLISVQQ
jgi:hypothetical protein